MKKSYIAAALALTSCMVVGTAAASQSNSVTATFRPDVTLKVNGTAYTVRDTTGVKVSPLIYNGTTYLPLSSLGQLLGAVVDFDSDIEDYTIPSDSTDLIGKDRAKELALKHAGLSIKEVSFVRVELDRDDGRAVYEVEFYSGSREYDYEINAVTGAVADFDSDIEDYTIPSDSKDYISREKAQKLAQAKAPKATLIKLELDVDDGRAVYEGELQDGSLEYEFEIDAVTGSFLKWEQERD